MSGNGSQAPVLIVGGGIGGLAAALALSRKGIVSHVIEQAPEFKEIGAGIQLGPNVFRMFEVLGITEEINKWAVFPQGLEFRDSMTGKTFVDLPVDHRKAMTIGRHHSQRTGVMLEVHAAQIEPSLVE